MLKELLRKRMCGFGFWKLSLSAALVLVILSEVAPQPCPAQCSCTGSTVDCHGLALRAVPRNIPRNTERLDLNGNNITRVTKTDFAGLKHLRVLQLMENKISTIERGAFQDLKELERLRLNRNNIQVLPELLFLGTPKLYRLVLTISILALRKVLKLLALIHPGHRPCPLFILAEFQPAYLLLINLLYCRLLNNGTLHY